MQVDHTRFLNAAFALRRARQNNRLANKNPA
jgi:hypothetical protein